MSNRIQLETVDSTNAYALANFADLPDHALVTAEQQSAGRGRRGKKWFSPPGTNIYASYIVKNPAFRTHCASWIGCLAALETLRLQGTGVNFWIKWPNDIYAGKEICESRKIAGVLCETRTKKASNKLDGIVIGIGININMRNEDLEKIQIPATSLFSLTGKIWPVNEIVETLHKKLLHLSALEEDELFCIWNKDNQLKGHGIKVSTEDGNDFTGILESLDSDGGIIVRNGTTTRKFHSGDVSVTI